jgi:hypothetical protein
VGRVGLVADEFKELAGDLLSPHLVPTKVHIGRRIIVLGVEFVGEVVAVLGVVGVLGVEEVARGESVEEVLQQVPSRSAGIEQGGSGRGGSPPTGYTPCSGHVRRQGLEPRTRGLRAGQGADGMSCHVVGFHTVPGRGLLPTFSPRSGWGDTDTCVASFEVLYLKSSRRLLNAPTRFPLRQAGSRSSMAQARLFVPRRLGSRRSTGTWFCG